MAYTQMRTRYYYFHHCYLFIDQISQVIPGVLRPDGVPMVRIQSDHDQRGVAVAPNVR